MQTSLTPKIVELAARTQTFATQIGTANTRAGDVAQRISKLGHDHSGSTKLPADDPRLVAIREDMAGVAGDVTAAIEGSRFPVTWEFVSPYADTPAGIQRTVERMERSREVNVDGLARSFGKNVSLSYSNASSAAESVAGAVKLLTRTDGTIRDVDGPALDAMVAELETVRTRWDALDQGLEGAYMAAQRLKDTGEAGDYRDDVLYTADLVKTVRPALQRTAEAMRSIVPDALTTLTDASRTGPVADARAGEVELIIKGIDDAAGAKVHSVDANDFLFSIEGVRGDSAGHRATSPSQVANGEAWDLRIAKQYAEQLRA